MIHEPLTDKNFMLYCAKHYDSKQCVSDVEFHDDLKRIKYLKKLLTRYNETGVLKERLILNHIIVLNNVFGPFHCARILFLKLQNNFNMIKPFLILLNILPINFQNVGKETVIYSDDISMDQNIVERVKTI